MRRTEQVLLPEVVEVDGGDGRRRVKVSGTHHQGRVAFGSQGPQGHELAQEPPAVDRCDVAEPDRQANDDEEGRRDIGHLVHDQLCPFVPRHPGGLLAQVLLVEEVPEPQHPHPVSNAGGIATLVYLVHDRLDLALELVESPLCCHNVGVLGKTNARKAQMSGWTGRESEAGKADRKEEEKEIGSGRMDGSAKTSSGRR